MKSSTALRIGALLFCASLASAQATEIPTPATPAAGACASLTSLALPDTRITAASEYPAGVNPVPAPPRTTGALKSPLSVAVCRVQGTIRPTPVSNIRFELWLPVSGWNGKYNGVGNGGVAGFINYSAMKEPLERGYAAGSTDTGHELSELDGSWMMDHPELVMDFAQRSQHLTVLAAKAIVKAYYGQAPAHAYFTGCSNGGGQAMQESQRFPTDYDGIVVGNAARFLTHEWPGELQPAWLARSDQAGLISKLPALNAAVLAQCDRLDGVPDGVIEDPSRCRFDPATLQCPAGVDNARCLTAQQVEWVRKIYRGIVDPQSGKVFWPGLAAGSELGWDAKIHPPMVLLPQNYMQVFVYRNLNWQYTDPGFSFESPAGLAALNAASTKYGSILDADDADLRPFEKSGGKIIFYHGWNDPNIAPANIIQYYQRVVSTAGGSGADAAERTARFARLFMAPGMGHCGGGPGPNSFDALGALDEWVAHGHAPEKIVASHSTQGVVDRTRPLCPYPQTAVYRGAGSTNEAANFTCATPGKS